MPALAGFVARFFRNIVSGVERLFRRNPVVLGGATGAGVYLFSTATGNMILLLMAAGAIYILMRKGR